MAEEQRTLSALYDLQENVGEDTDFTKVLNDLVNELEKRIQEKHLTPLL